MYDLYPETVIHGHDASAWEGYALIGSQLAAQGKRVVVVECYPGVDDAEVLPQLVKALRPALIVESRHAFYSGTVLTQMMQPHLTDDRVFGVMYYGVADDFIHEEKRAELRRRIEAEKEGVVLVYGFGASRIVRGDLIVYADLARWEIQLRYRSGKLGNFNCDNLSEDTLRKYKRAFFVEWRIADKLKAGLFDSIDFLLDTNQAGAPRMITGGAFRAALDQIAHRPLRLVPYFDPGVWGGQWMKQTFGLDPEKHNYAWSFDGVPEENSLLLRVGGVRIEIPAMDLVLYRPRALLGEGVYARFGAEFPIRFDLLDTMGGGNLSLQVHPVTEYAKKSFGMPYTQDESYYILDAEEGASVYLGLREGIDPEEMLDGLDAAQRGSEFDAERYVNRFPARKHDHFLIPAGTVHCSGSGTMVLEVSATPYIFTFKMWDWSRLGLDGLPRPTHIQHAKQVIDWNRTTGWVRQNLINQMEEQCEDGVPYQRTGLHRLEFIETRRYAFSGAIGFDTRGTVHMLNLVEGEALQVKSPSGAFAPFTVHFAETFILPASLGKVTLRAPKGEVKLLCAFVKGTKEG